MPIKPKEIREEEIIVTACKIFEACKAETAEEAEKIAYDFYQKNNREQSKYYFEVAAIIRSRLWLKCYVE